MAITEHLAFLPLFTGNDSSTSQSVANSVINKVMNEVKTSINNSTESLATSFQSVKIKLTGNGTPNCKVDLTQKSEVSSTATAQYFNTKTSEIENKIKNELQNTLSELLDQNAEFLSLSKNRSETNQDIENYISNKVSNVVSTTINNTVSASASDEKVAEIEVENCNFEVDATQDGIITAVADQLANNLVSDMITNDTINDIFNQLDAEKTQETGGLFNSGSLTSLIICLVIAGLLFVGLYLFYPEDKRDNENDD